MWFAVKAAFLAGEFVKEWLPVFSMSRVQHFAFLLVLWKEEKHQGRTDQNGDDPGDVSVLIAEQNCDLNRCIDFRLPRVAFPLAFAPLGALGPISPGHAG